MSNQSECAMTGKLPMVPAGWRGGACRDGIRETSPASALPFTGEMDLGLDLEAVRITKAS